MNQAGAQQQIGTNAPFCAAGPGGPGCWYWDLASCERAAARTGGRCESRR
jgi:hypothetical protein